MSEQQAETDIPQPDPFSMTARNGRRLAALQVAQLITLAIPLVGILIAEGAGARSTGILSLTLIPLLIVQVRALFCPGAVALNGQQVFINGHRRLTTQRENIEHLLFNDGAGLVFRDLEQVKPDGGELTERRLTELRSTLAGSLRKSGVHIQLEGFSIDEVECLRKLLGMATPEDGSEVFVLEQYHRSLVKRTPLVWISPLLIALNAGMFAVLSMSGESVLSITASVMLRWGADFGPLTLDGELWRLLTCTFLHSGIFHLLCNMWGLHHGGRLVERLAGNFGFLMLYLFSGVAGSLLSMWWSPEAVCAGASGAVLGIYGALFAWHLRRRQDIPQRIVRDVRNRALPFFGCNLLLGFLIPNIDLAAHVGGILAGFLSGAILAGSQATDLQAGRQLRLLGLSILAMCIIVIGILQLPGLDEIPGLPGELRRTAAMEKRVLFAYQSAATSLQSGRMSGEEFVQLLRSQILPEWKQSLERLRSVSGEAGTTPTIALMIQYLQLRAEAWELIAEAVESDNEELMAQVKEKWAEATRIGEQVAESRQ